MYILVYKTFYATRTASDIRQATCEQCAKMFTYPIHVTVRGAGSSPFFLTNARARRQAETRADKNLQLAMQNAICASPCPHCGWFPSAMVRAALNRELRWMRLAAWIGLIGGTLFLLMLHITLSDQGRHPDYPERHYDIAAEVALILAFPILLLLRAKLVERGNPNTT